MGLFGNYCLIISILGALFLFGLGLALKYDYQYIDIEERPDHAVTCY